ncbi:parasitic phase-specific protein PSP-1 [Astrocystis sublimbata]|nr:parasitic phase-specific protein PSP-1 [Astrocystis sublimbata]
MNSTTGHVPIIPFGPHATCTLEICPIEYSIFQYRPSLAANATFGVLHFILMFAHLGLGLRLGNWWYSGCMIAGCASNVIGYAARASLWFNPFSFNGFLLQIIFVGSSPVFYTAAIYVTISKTVQQLDLSLSRIRPNLYYTLFIFFDVLALVLQASGGAISTVSSGANNIGVNLALAGLISQVVTLLAFVSLLADYLIRYFRSKPSAGVSKPLKTFLTFLSIAIALILVRCAYRVAELSDGYSGTLFHDEALFVGLEGVLIIIAVISLFVAHPGFVFNGKTHLIGNSSLKSPTSVESGDELPER